jgi:mannosidase alpha-like ER degradation enhancer 1
VSGMVLWPFPISAVIYVVSLVLSLQPAAAAYSRRDKVELRALARDTWMHAYKSYRRVAWPADEVKPLSCSSQGHDRRHPENLEVNDVMGDFSLTLVDSLDAFCVSCRSGSRNAFELAAAYVAPLLQVLRDRAGFEQAVRETIQHVSFDRDSRVQVFEVTIRMLGGLVSSSRTVRALESQGLILGPGARSCLVINWPQIPREGSRCLGTMASSCD